MSRVLGSSYESVTLDGRSLEMVAEAAAELRSMDHQFGSLKHAGVVAYFPVETKAGMVTTEPD